LPHPAISPELPLSPNPEKFRDRESFSSVFSDTDPRGTVSGSWALAPFWQLLGVNTAAVVVDKAKFSLRPWFIQRVFKRQYFIV
jgi:hypothetical protein